jgi:hypothetical protein
MEDFKSLVGYFQFKVDSTSFSLKGLFYFDENNNEKYYVLEDASYEETFTDSNGKRFLPVTAVKNPPYVKINVRTQPKFVTSKLC